MASLYDIVGLIFSLLGVFGTLQRLWSIVQRYLPIHQLELLENTYVEACSLYDCGVEENLLLESEARALNTKLELAHSQITKMHFKVAHLRGFWCQLRGIFKNLSRKMTKLGVDVEELRLEIISTSEKGRRELEAGQRLLPAPVSHSLSLPWRRYAVQADRRRNNADELRPSDVCATSPSPSLTSLDHLPPSMSRLSTHRDSVCSVSTTATVVNRESPEDTTKTKWSDYLTGNCFTDSPEQIPFIPAAHIVDEGASIPTPLLTQVLHPKFTAIDFRWVTTGLLDQARILEQVQSHQHTPHKADPLRNSANTPPPKPQHWNSLNTWRRSQVNPLLPI